MRRFWVKAFRNNGALGVGEEIMERKRLSWLWLMAVLLALAFPACAGSEDESAADGDAEQEASEDGDADAEDETEAPGEPFRFVIFSDTHVRLPGNPDDADYDNQLNLDNLDGAIARVNAEFADAAFVAVTGDMVGALFSENPDDYGTDEPNPAETFKAMMDGLSVPYHAIMGNHDYQKSYDPELGEGVATDDIDAVEAVWKKVLGIDPYYSTVYEGVRFVFLNANRGEARTVVCAGETEEAFCTGSFDEEQMGWFESELAQGEPVVVFLHHPPVTDSKNSMFAVFDSFLIEPEDSFYDIAETHKDRILGIFVGHGHIWERDAMFETIPVYETGSIGDLGGHPDNIHIVDVDPATPSITVTIGREEAEYFSDQYGAAE